MARASTALIITISAIFVVIAYLHSTTAAQSTPVNISLGSTFSGDETIRSRSELFELGLFKPSGSSSSYLGIWYVGISPRTVVWVGNRNQPAVGSASFLLSSDGNFMVRSSDRSVLWSSGTKGMNVSAAVLMDTGNLVLQSWNSSSVWESFSHPTHVWLPTMRLGPGMRLISWKTLIDPAEGPYSLQMLPSGEFVSLWNNSDQYWTSGKWNGKTFDYVPEMGYKIEVFNMTYNLQSGFEWSVYPSAIYPSAMPFKISIFSFEINGQINFSSWDADLKGWLSYWSKPTDRCDVYGVCGPYGVCNSSSSGYCSCPDGFVAADPKLWSLKDYSGGCKQTKALNCSAKGSNDLFVRMSNNNSFDTERFAVRLSGVDENKCISYCTQKCSCAAYYYEETTKNCSLMSEVLWSSSPASGEFHVRVSHESFPSLSRAPHKKSSVGIIVGAVSAVGAVVILLILGFLLLHQNGLRARFSKLYIPGELNRFTYRQLQSTTRKFTQQIGAGAFGAVFKGVLPDNTPVAVKKLQRLDQGEKQFRAEVSTIGSIQHVNLVRLLGFCSEGFNRLLVLEYMPNGSLDQLLFKRSSAAKERRGVLDWKTRFTIALGTARALAYLHEECRECIIHCDIKPENILLDANFCAKVSDFGLAKLVGREFSHVLTSLRGTRGYLAPEWIAGLPITAKADVYSYGMTLLEVISGRRNLDTGRGEKFFFPVWAAMQMSEGEVMGLADEELEGKVEEEELRRAAYAAVWCIQDEEEMRPGMGRVVQILEGDVEVPKPPVPVSLHGLFESGHDSSISSVVP